MLNQKEDEEHEEMDRKGIQDWHINTDDPWDHYRTGNMELKD